MTTKAATEPAAPAGTDIVSDRNCHWECQPHQFAGGENGLNDRHLIFDHSLRVLLRIILCTILLVPCVVWAQNEPTEPYYHWPEYPPFSPGSWAWPTTGRWEYPSFYQNYGAEPRSTTPAQSPPTIIVFPPVPTPQVQANQNVTTNQPWAPAGTGGSPVAVSPRLSPENSKPQQGSPLYLIALKEGLIRPALSYRVEGTTLRYMDLDGAPNEVPLDRVDRALSAELNRQRRVPFQLPPEE